MAASKEAHEKEKHGVEKHFAQHLAANEVRTRDRAVKKVAKWMKARSAKDTGFDKEELLKLWKGLYYCMWMSDKMLVQEDLADSLAEMVHNMATPKQGLLFYQTFLITIGREWHGIDYLRVDKFYMLFRRVLRQTLMVLQKNAWEPRLVKSFLKTLNRLVFRSTSDWYPSGLRLFMVDIYIEELSRASSDELTKEHVLWFLEPLVRLAAETKEFTLTDSIMTVVFEEIVNQAWLGQEDEGEEREFEFLEEANKKVKVEGVKAFEELPMLEFDHEAISALLLKYASKPGTLSRNRKRIYKTTVLYRNLLQGVHPSQLLKPLKKDRVDRFMKIDNPQRAEMMMRAKKKSKDRLRLFLQRRKERKLQRQGALRGQRTDEGGVREGADTGMMSILPTEEGGPSSDPQVQELEGGRDVGDPMEGVSGSGTEAEKSPSSKRKRRKRSKARSPGIDVSPEVKERPPTGEGVKVRGDGKEPQILTGRVEDSLSEDQKSQDRMGDEELPCGGKVDSLATVLFKDMDDVEDVAMKNVGQQEDRSEGAVSPRKIKKTSKKTRSSTKGEGDGKENVEGDAAGRMDEGEKMTDPSPKMNDKKKTPKRTNKRRGESGEGTRQQDDDLMGEPVGGESSKKNKVEGGKQSETGGVVDLGGKGITDKEADIPKKKTPRKGRNQRRSTISEDDPARKGVDAEVVKAESKMVASDSGEKGGAGEVATSSGKKTPRRGRKKRTSSFVSDEGVAETSSDMTAADGRERKDGSTTEDQGDLKEMTLEEASEGKTPRQDKKKRKSAGTDKKLKRVQESSEDIYSPPVTRKRVKIALAHNEELPSADYRRRIKASPGIPFDKERKPQSPAIKPAPPTPVRRSARKKQKSVKLA